MAISVRMSAYHYRTAWKACITLHPDESIFDFVAWLVKFSQKDGQGRELSIKADFFGLSASAKDKIRVIVYHPNKLILRVALAERYNLPNVDLVDDQIPLSQNADEVIPEDYGVIKPKASLL